MVEATQWADRGQILQPDLAEPGQGVKTATSLGQRVPEGHVYVGQSRVSSETWYRLTQVGK